MRIEQSLREWRKAEGISAKALADLLGIGINRVYKLERIPRLLTADERAALIALGAPVKAHAEQRVRNRAVRPGRRPHKPAQAVHKPVTAGAALLADADAPAPPLDPKIAAIFAPLIQEARERFEQIARERQERAERMHGGPRDTAVQRLALMQLGLLRDDRGLTWEEIGVLAGVSGERARTLYIQLTARHSPTPPSG